MANPKPPRSILNIFLRVNIARFAVPIAIGVGILVFLFLSIADIPQLRRGGIFYFLIDVFGRYGAAFIIGLVWVVIAWAFLSDADENITEEERERLSN